MKATPTSVRNHPEMDGSHLVNAKLEDGTDITIVFDRGQVANTVQAFQTGMIAEATKTAKEFGAAIAPLLGSSAGTSPNGPTIQVSIGEIGLIVFEASDECLLKLKADIDRALKMRLDRQMMN